MVTDSIAERKQIDAVLDLVGNTTFMDSLSMLRRGARMCLAGWLGGLDPVNNFNPLLQMPSGVYFTFFASFVFGTQCADLTLFSWIFEKATYRCK
jgi:NADPH:quinone reductase